MRDFDLFGLSFSTELGSTNMLTALDLAGIPLHAAQRTDADPVVLAGGHAAFNPEPVADFLDAVALGDGQAATVDRDRVPEPGVDGHVRASQREPDGVLLLLDRLDPRRRRP